MCGQLTAADDPEILLAGGSAHRLVYGPHITLHEADVGALDQRQAISDQ